MRVVLLTSIIAACSAVTLYNPPNAGAALDAVEKALANIVNSPHLSKTQLTQAKQVAADVEKTVEELESVAGKKLSEKERGAKVTASIQELQKLQDNWSKGASAKDAELLTKLKAKEAELAKDKKMLKVINMEKALAEKKLALQKLIQQKDAKENAAQEKLTQKEAAARQEMVASVLTAAKAIKDKQSKAVKVIDSSKLKPVMSYLEARTKELEQKVAKLDAAEKKREGELKEIVDKPAPVQDNKDPLAKGQGILKMLLKKEHRQFEKARVTLQSELKELNQATDSIKKGDVASLTKVMSHMQGEMKSLEAKSHKFLY